MNFLVNYCFVGKRSDLYSKFCSVLLHCYCTDCIFLLVQTYREFQRLSEGIGFRTLYVDKIGNDPTKVKKATKKIGMKDLCVKLFGL